MKVPANTTYVARIHGVVQTNGAGGTLLPRFRSETNCQTITIKAGSLDEPVDISRAMHIWTSRKLPGTVIPPGAKQYPEEPPD